MGGLNKIGYSVRVTGGDSFDPLLSALLGPHHNDHTYDHKDGDDDDDNGGYGSTRHNIRHTPIPYGSASTLGIIVHSSHRNQPYTLNRDPSKECLSAGRARDLTSASPPPFLSLCFGPSPRHTAALDTSISIDTTPVHLQALPRPPTRQDRPGETRRDRSELRPGWLV